MSTAGKNLTQQVEELTKQVQRLEVALETHRTVTDFRIKNLEAQLADRTKAEEQLTNKVSELTTKNATLEERARNQEKTADRGWQLWLADLGFGFGLISLLITAALQLKK